MSMYIHIVLNEIFPLQLAIVPLSLCMQSQNIGAAASAAVFSTPVPSLSPPPELPCTVEVVC